MGKALHRGRRLVSCTLKLATLSFVIGLALASCQGGDALERMEQIRRVGDENPRRALEMLDSMEDDIKDENQYVRMRCELLHIVLCDKADIAPGSDTRLKRLLTYFERKGSQLEKQEACYYVGRAYLRQMQESYGFDCLFKSMDYALSAPAKCDSLLLLDTYRGLHWHYSFIQYHSYALKMGQEELNLCRQMRTDDVPALIHVGDSYAGMDSLGQAEAAFDSAYSHIVRSDDPTRFRHQLILLLQAYTSAGCLEKAEECKRRIEENAPEGPDAARLLAFARFYAATEDYDSARACCQRILDEGTDIRMTGDASRLMFSISCDLADDAGAVRHAKRYIEAGDSLLRLRQKEIRAAADIYIKGHQSLKKKTQTDNERQSIIFFVAGLVVLAFVLYLIYREKRHRRIVSIFESDIEAKDSQLTEKEGKESALISIIHQSEMEAEAGNIMEMINLCARTGRHLAAADWRGIYQTVDKLDPAFKGWVLGDLGITTERHMQLLYLMRIGLTGSQIENLTDFSRQTIWRWRKKYNIRH